MRLCRYRHQDQLHVGIYGEQAILPLAATARAYADATHRQLDLPQSTDLLSFAPPDGVAYDALRQLATWLENADGKPAPGVSVPTAEVELLVPIPRPNKLFLLAGNYADHIQEGGGKAAEREETFPYVFMKPPSTTLADPGRSVIVPRVSPDYIDWELELAVVMGREAKGVKEADALQYVAGYTVINDISNRKFRPNPRRQEREKDKFFDWLHGKWFDSFCPCGPCLTLADAVADPQKLSMKLTVNDQVKQDASTGQMIFPVAAIIEFISSFVTLEPGDIISTGTPSGVGSASGTFWHDGDVVHASIEGIGTLVSPIQAENA